MTMLHESIENDGKCRERERKGENANIIVRNNFAHIEILLLYCFREKCGERAPLSQLAAIQ